MKKLVMIVLFGFIFQGIGRDRNGKRFATFNVALLKF